MHDHDIPGHPSKTEPSKLIIPGMTKSQLWILLKELLHKVSLTFVCPWVWAQRRATVHLWLWPGWHRAPGSHHHLLPPRSSTGRYCSNSHTANLAGGSSPLSSWLQWWQRSRWECKGSKVKAELASKRHELLSTRRKGSDSAETKTEWGSVTSDIINISDGKSAVTVLGFDTQTFSILCCLRRFQEHFYSFYLTHSGYHHKLKLKVVITLM